VRTRVVSPSRQPFFLTKPTTAHPSKYIMYRRFRHRVRMCSLPDAKRQAPSTEELQRMANELHV
jgi:hypothetical protein